MGLISLDDFEKQLGGAPQAPSQQPEQTPSSANIPMVMTGANIGGATMAKDPLAMKAAELAMANQAAIEKTRQEKGIEGAGPDITGRVTLAKEALRSIADVKKRMFPDGTPQSFNRMLAFASNLPRISVPFTKISTPSARPDNPFDPRDDKGASNAQNVNREMGTALSGRQLIQTGVAARPEETQALVDQFAPKLTSAAESALNGLNQLERFYTEFLQGVDPQGVKGVNVAPKKKSYRSLWGE